MNSKTHKNSGNVKNFNQFLNENISYKSISTLILTLDFTDKVNDILKNTFDDYDVRYSNHIISDKISKVSLKSLNDDRTVYIIYDVDIKKKKYIDGNLMV